MTATLTLRNTKPHEAGFPRRRIGAQAAVAYFVDIEESADGITDPSSGSVVGEALHQLITEQGERLSRRRATVASPSSSSQGHVSAVEQGVRQIYR